MAAGLLILRVTLGLTVLLRGLALFHSEHLLGVDNGIYIAGMLAAALLLTGLFAVPAAALSAALCASALAPMPTAYLFEPDTATLLAGAIATSIALLGPGAFSIDARLFGPREIVFPVSTGRSGNPSDPID